MILSSIRPSRREGPTLELIGAAAAAAFLGHGDVEVEAALLEAVDEVEGGTFEEQLAFLIDDEVFAVEVVAAVLGFVVLVVEEQAVAVAAAAAGDDFYAKEHLGASLGPFFMALELGSGFFGERDSRHGLGYLH